MHTPKLTEADRTAWVRKISFDSATQSIPNVFISLVFNRETPIDVANKALRAFWTALQRRVYGESYSQYLAGFEAGSRHKLRGSVITAPAWFAHEHPDSNIHYHGVARFTKQHYERLGLKEWKAQTDDGYKLQMHSKFLSELWKELVPAGSIEIQRIKKDELTETIKYVMKDIHTVAQADRLVVSPLFGNQLAG